LGTIEITEPQRWQTPWSPIKISDCEWIIIRDSVFHPEAIIRRLDLPNDVSAFRVVTWAERSTDRELIGYTRNVELADMMVRFSRPSNKPPWIQSGMTAADWAHTGPPNGGAPGH